MSICKSLRSRVLMGQGVVPGMVQTELWDKMGQSKEQQKANFEKVAEKLPVGFVATAEDIAEAYLYCIRADYANGSLITIDGT